MKKLLALALCVFIGHVLASTATAQDQAEPVTTDNIPNGELIRMDSLFLLDYSEKMLQGMNMLFPYKERIEKARMEIEMADTVELEATPGELTSALRSAGLAMAQANWAMNRSQQRQASGGKGSGTRIERTQGVLGQPTAESTEFLYVDLMWPPSEVELGLTGFGGDGTQWIGNFNFDELEAIALNASIFIANILGCESGILEFFGAGEVCDALDIVAENTEKSGYCAYWPDAGISYTERNGVLNAALAAEGVKDAAEQICGMDIVGFNISPVCIVTDIAYIVAVAVEQNQELCNDSIGAAELTATFAGVEAINTNMGTMYETLMVHDEAIADQLVTHDGELKGAVSTHDSEIKALLQSTLDNQATIIELLITPQGNRPGWND
jgi:hypothetical protein